MSTYQVGFLIIHEGRDGVWVLFHWWTRGEMIETKLFFVSYDTPKKIGAPHESSLVCIWELEIIQFEREQWIQHILRNPDAPRINEYLQSGLNKNA